ncbi:MAG: fibronectin type III domain-containing protein [Clostridium sp.]|nr:fibronectin type III domain-containing protein [Clostridium sp.]
MKKVIKLFSVILAVLLVFQSTIAANASTTSVSAYTGRTYTHQTRFDKLEKLNGIDVSEHNGSIDFKKIKAAGIDFVFVRVGWTGYTRSKHSLNYDDYYKQNITNAINAGLSVGVYWYSQALTEKEAVAEAKKLTEVIGNYNITLPVVMDYEFADTSGGRLDYAWKNAEINKTQMTANALAFLDEINKAGYTGCLYANASFLTTQLNASQISENYKIWLAHYTTNTNYSGEYEFWQYSSSGKIAGKTYDVNYWYIPDESNYLENYIYTGKKITPSPIITDEDTILTENEDYTLRYNNNTNLGTATITATGMNDYEGKSWTYKFKIVLDRVTNLKLDKSRTTESISIKWNAVKGASSYYIYVNNNTQGTSFTKTTTKTSIILNNLTPSNQYSIKVRAVKGNSYGEYSAVLKAHTVPDKVTGLKTSSRTTSTVTLSWDKKKGASGYKIYLYYPSKKEAVLVGTVKGVNNTSFKISNRKQGTVYYYKVAAYVSDSGISDRTGYKSSQHATTAKPNTPTVSTLSTPSKKKMKLSWKGTTCTGYQVQWSTTNKFTSNYKSVYTKSKSTTISTAQSKKKYYVRVRAYKTVDGKKIYGAWSKTKSIKVK